MNKAAEAIQRKLAAAAREDIDIFAEYVFRFRQASCHNRIQKHITDFDRAAILAHKELGKTTQALLRVLWELGRNPEIRIKIVCAGDDSAVDRVMFLRDLIDRNPRLHAVFPRLVKSPHFDDWGKHSLTVERKRYEKDSSVEACGILTSATGGRADLLLFDDVCDFQNSIQHPSMRKQVKDAFRNIWMAMLAPGGRAFYLATRHHEEDLTGELLKNGLGEFGRWEWVDLSVKGDPPESPWPERWTKEALIKRLDDIGSIEFDRSMRNILHPDSERVVRKDWIRMISPTSDRWPIKVCSWDFAASGNQGDWTARAVVEIRPSDKAYKIKRADKWQGKTYNETIDLILEDFAIEKPDVIIVERTAFQVIIGRDERLLAVPIEEYVPVVNKEQRVRQTARLYERGMVLFEDGMTTGLIDELLKFPKTDHDDQVDALTQGLLWGIRKFGSFPDLSSVKSTGHRVFSDSSGVVDLPRSTSVSDEPTHSRRAGFRSMTW